MPLPIKILLTFISLSFFYSCKLQTSDCDPFISQWDSLKNVQKAAEQKGKEQSFNDEIEEQEQINNEEDDLSAPQNYYDRGTTDFFQYDYGVDDENN